MGNVKLDVEDNIIEITSSVATIMDILKGMAGNLKSGGLQNNIKYNRQTIPH